MRAITLLNLTVLISIVACSGNYRPETLANKSARYKTKSRNVNPPILVTDETFNKIHFYSNSRNPATAIDSELTNAQIYFLTLTEQYLDLAKWQTAPFKPFKSCSSFHSMMVKKSFYGKIPHKESFTTDTWKLNPFFLSFAGNNKNVNHKMMSKAVQKYIQRTRDEIQKLCDVGSSENYYKWENLTTQMKRSQIYSSVELKKAMIKIPIFFNKTLLEEKTPKSKGRLPASYKENSIDEAMSRVNWNF